MDVLARLKALGLTLPPVPKPVAAYVPAVRVGDLVYTSGQLPFRDGKLVATGLVPIEVSVEEAYQACRISVLNALAAVAMVADLDQVRQVVRVGGFVAADASFHDHPKVVNGASDLLMEIWQQSGQHARTAVGVASLPLGAPVEIEMVVQL
ncbi:MAG: RidA family protein [Sulfobacillus sp.]